MSEQMTKKSAPTRGLPAWTTSRATVTGAALWLAGMLAVLIVSTPLTNDDIANHSIHEYSEQTHQSLWGIISFFTKDWMTNQGRFFPGSLAWSYTLHWYTGSVVEYKLAVALVLTLSLAALVLLVRRITGSWHAAGMTVVALATLIQVRLGYDSITEFAALFPWVLLLVASTMLILLTRSGWRWWLVAALLYALAVVTYETTVAFVPVLAVVVLMKRRGWRAILPMVVPAMAQLAMVAHLRSQMVAPPLPAYAMNLDPVEVGRTLWFQMSGALPLSQWWLGSGSAPSISTAGVGIALVVVGMPVWLIFRWVLGQEWSVNRRDLLQLVALGFWMILTSSGLVAIAQRWQDELVSGSAYVPVFFGYVGLAMVVVAAVGFIHSRLMRLGSRAHSVAVSLLSSSAAVLAALVFAGNLAVVAAR